MPAVRFDGGNSTTTWYGPEASNRAYLSTAALMERYADRLRRN